MSKATGPRALEKPVIIDIPEHKFWGRILLHIIRAINIKIESVVILISSGRTAPTKHATRLIATWILDHRESRVLVVLELEPVIDFDH